jgi:hypothetical protein
MRISSSWGVRFSGGRHLITLQMYVSSRFKPMASMILSSSWPARPTKGRPVRSSSRPGPSPAKSSRAFGLPSPNTMWLRPECSRQRVQSPISCRSSSSFAWTSSAESGLGCQAGVAGASAGDSSARAPWPNSCACLPLGASMGFSPRSCMANSHLAWRPSPNW